jgi:hypothetical protein
MFANVKNTLAYFVGKSVTNIFNFNYRGTLEMLKLVLLIIPGTP